MGLESVRKAAMNHILFFGFGFSARALARRLDPVQWKISGTSRDDEGVAEIATLGFNGVLFDQLHNIPEDVTHIVSSVPPGPKGDPVITNFGASLSGRARLIISHIVNGLWS